MRCSEARLRLDRLLQDGRTDIDDALLQEHLDKCPQCAREAAAMGMLRQMFVASAVDETADIKPLAMQRREIEARSHAAGAGRYRRAVHGSSPRRLRYAVAASVAVVLVIASLIPFKYDLTVGYDLALKGVTRDLAENDERVCEILYNLGLSDAGVDLLGCDTTCNIQIIDLKSHAEVQLVITAFDRLHQGPLTTDIIPVVTKASGSLLERANERVFQDRHENAASNATS